MKLFPNILFLSLFLFSIPSCITDTEVPKNGLGPYAVTKISDGDTFWIDNGSAKGEKIRLIGLDAPESMDTFKKKKGYFGTETKEYLTNLLKNKSVLLDYDVERTDKYGRTLAYVYLTNGTFVNADLIKNGYAVVMTIKPNVKFANEFKRLQQEAKQKKLGLWKD